MAAQKDKRMVDLLAAKDEEISALKRRNEEYSGFIEEYNEYIDHQNAEVEYLRGQLICGASSQDKAENGPTAEDWRDAALDVVEAIGYEVEDDATFSPDDLFAFVTASDNETEDFLEEQLELINDYRAFVDELMREFFTAADERDNAVQELEDVRRPSLKTLIRDFIRVS